MSDLKLFLKKLNGKKDESSDSEVSTYTLPTINYLVNTERLNVHWEKTTKLIVMRHSERMDDIFGEEWYEIAHKAGKYISRDPNMPAKLPTNRPFLQYKRDTCLTVKGIEIAKLTGKSLLDADLTPDVIYCSPALRSIETAYYVRSASNSKAQIRIEAGLFENGTLYSSYHPPMITKEERARFGIDETYTSLYSMQEVFNNKEGNDEYNRRYHSTLWRIANMSYLTTDNNKKKKGFIAMCVGHASSIDLAVGHLRNPPRITTQDELHQIGLKIPYCSTLYMKVEKDRRSWRPIYGIPAPVEIDQFSNEFVVEFVNRN